ncbi:hypothetical protein H109_00710 [Trichophyton interdigitale MR816]|uniref:Uncharacterized protein n=1 Tax=Trichophyton interdigitale (strain MR816) TaxID=1215338 RepID=A0A059JIC1_TRIIM|nr:hypothetical protein H101_03583 [Trichophyton interdigitale H6]KDB27549.1 hypothetical protein H109_00710 [Trichophyton interdigitale MR816]
MLSSTTVAFASPVAHTDNAPQWFRPSNDGRLRSSRGSSEDNDEGLSDGWIDQDLRAGGPILAHTPSVTIYYPIANSPHREIMDPRLELCRSIQTALDEANIRIKTFDFCYRRCKSFPEGDLIPTFLVDATRESIEDKWLSASQTIYKLLRNYDLTMFNVEICDDRLNLTRYPSPVPPSDPIYPLWDKVLSEILNNINCTNVLTVECFRFGHNNDPETDPTTIIVTVEQTSTFRSWRGSREKIISILDSYNLQHVGIKITWGLVHRGRDSLDRSLPDSSWQAPLQVGLSLGVYGSKYSSSTFGGWIEIKQEAESEWQKVGLTCFRSILETFPTGIPLGSPITKGLLKVEQPSLKDTMLVIEDIATALSRPPDSRLTAVKEVIEEDCEVSPRSRQRYEKAIAKFATLSALKSKIEDFHKPCSQCNDLLSSSLPINPRLGTTLEASMDVYSQSYAGRVCAGSGYRQFEAEGVLRQADWALIDVPESRHSENELSTYGMIGHTDFTPLQPFVGIPEASTALYKLGRSTEITRGSFSGLKSAHLNIPDGRGGVHIEPTFEYSVTSPSPYLFSDPGDSGALVFDYDSNCIGMIFAGNPISRVSYITLLPDLFTDIKTITGAFDVRIAE